MKLLQFLKCSYAFFLLACFVSTSWAEQEVNAVLSSTNKDYASTQGVFGPGPDFRGRLPNDFEWTAQLKLEKQDSIKSILIQHSVSGEAQAWTTSSERFHGKDIYPLVVFEGSKQLNKKYDDIIGPLAASTHELKIYGQMESLKFLGGILTVTLAEGGALTAAIPPSELTTAPLDNSVMGCKDSDGGANYFDRGTITYTSSASTVNTFEDYCIDRFRVAEGVCGGIDFKERQFVLSHGLCKEGCENGACIGEESPRDYEVKVERLGASASIPACEHGWKLTLVIDRQKAIQQIMVLGGNEKTPTVLPYTIFYRGEKLKPNYESTAEPFEVGELELILCSQVPFEQSVSSQRVFINFADGSKITQVLK